MIDARLHVRYLNHLKVKEMEEVGSEHVDLIGNTSEGLRGVALCLLQRMTFVWSLNYKNE